MANQVAVLVNAEGSACNLTESGRIMIHERQSGAWKVIKEKPFQLGQDSLNSMRRQMAELVNLLEGCKIFVAKAVSGMPYFELEKAGCSIWEFEGTPPEFLDFVIEKEEEAQEEKVPLMVIPKPTEVEPGIFHISIKDIQENQCSISSKQVLQSFIRQGKFYSLTIRCNHVPPWLDGEIIFKGLAMDKVKLNDHELILTITKPCCK